MWFCSRRQNWWPFMVLSVVIRRCLFCCNISYIFAVFLQCSNSLKWKASTTFTLVSNTNDQNFLSFKKEENPSQLSEEKNPKMFGNYVQNWCRIEVWTNFCPRYLRLCRSGICYSVCTVGSFTSSIHSFRKLR